LAEGLTFNVAMYQLLLFCWRAVKYTIKVRDGDTVESSPEDGAEFVVKGGSPIPAFERVLTGMAKGEKVSLVIRSDCKPLACSRTPIFILSPTFESSLRALRTLWGFLVVSRWSS
jgi:hypothetical protein